MSLIPDTYTPFSYVDYPVDGVSASTDTTVFAFGKEFLKLDHIEVWHRTGSDDRVWTQLTSSEVSLAGSSAALTVTLTGSAPARSFGDVIRILRRTPETAAGRIVGFANGSLSAGDLAVAQLQNLYVAQEVRDLVELRLGLESDEEEQFDAQNKRLVNLAAPSLGHHAARLQDVNAAVIGAGNLPDPSALTNGSTLVADDGIWSVQTAEQLRTALGFAAAASRDVGVGVDDVPDIEIADDRYAQRANNLNDLGNVASARANLGFPTSNPAALLQTTDEGIAADRVVELDNNARYPAADGRNIDLSAHSLVTGGQGVIEAVMRLRLGVIGQTFTAALATIDIPAQTPEVLLNSNSDIAVDTATDRVTLKTGTYLIYAHIEWTNQGAGLSDVSWRLRRGVTGTPSFWHTQVNSHTPPISGSTLTPVTQSAFRSVQVTAASEVFDFQAQMPTLFAGDPRIQFGTVLILKIGV